MVEPIGPQNFTVPLSARQEKIKIICFGLKFYGHLPFRYSTDLCRRGLGKVSPAACFGRFLRDLVRALSDVETDAGEIATGV